MSFERWLLWAIANDWFYNQFREVENTPKYLTKMLTVYLACNFGLFVLSPHKFKISAKKWTPLTSSYAQEHSKYFALIQWSTIICWHIMKSSVHICLSQLRFHSSIWSAVWTINTWTSSMLYHMSDKWLAWWMGQYF